MMYGFYNNYKNSVTIKYKIIYFVITREQTAKKKLHIIKYCLEISRTVFTCLIFSSVYISLFMGRVKNLKLKIN